VRGDDISARGEYRAFRLTKRYGMWAEARRYSALMLAARMIGHHLSISALWWA
jgi:hypothetical protein